MRWAQPGLHLVMFLIFRGQNLKLQPWCGQFPVRRPHNVVLLASSDLQRSLGCSATKSEAVVLQVGTESLTSSQIKILTFYTVSAARHCHVSISLLSPRPSGV